MKNFNYEKEMLIQFQKELRNSNYPIKDAIINLFKNNAGIGVDAVSKDLDSIIDWCLCYLITAPDVQFDLNHIIKHHLVNRFDTVANDMLHLSEYRKFDFENLSLKDLGYILMVLDQHQNDFLGDNWEGQNYKLKYNKMYFIVLADVIDMCANFPNEEDDRMHLLSLVPQYEQ